MSPADPEPDSPDVSPASLGDRGWRRWAECGAVFGALPAAVAFFSDALPLIPLLWVMAAVCFVGLWRDQGFDRRRLWNTSTIRRGDWLWVLGRFVGCAALLAGLLYACLGQEVWGLSFPSEMFMFPRTLPGWWIAFVLLYPVVSVIPQNLVWRAFFFRRYRGLFGDNGAMVAASAVAFGWVHVVMLNWFAVVATCIGGVMFAQTYRRSGSMALASMEHALYGCWVFTVGYGLMFLYGSLPPEAREMMRSAAGQ